MQGELARSQANRLMRTPRCSKTRSLCAIAATVLRFVAGLWLAPQTLLYLASAAWIGKPSPGLPFGSGRFWRVR